MMMVSWIIKLGEKELENKVCSKKDEKCVCKCKENDYFSSIYKAKT